MGQVASQPAPSGFSAVWEALPEAAREETSALASKASTTLTRPHPAAPQPFPSVPVGVVVRIDSKAAQAALSLVPRLQQKHYESIRGAHTETHFWVNFFTHATQIVAHAAPHLLQHLVSAWKGNPSLTPPRPPPVPLPPPPPRDPSPTLPLPCPYPSPTLPLTLPLPFPYPPLPPP